MATVNPFGRANYEPNSWGGAAGGPREDPDAGFRSYAAEESGPKRRLRPESFADHYSQARQFYLSQDPVERKHIGDAFVFELSKVETLAIRERMVANLRNVDEELARTVADGLGLLEMPRRSPAAQETRTDLPDSPALSILRNPPESFAGRKIGALVTDGVDAQLLVQLERATDAEGLLLEYVAPRVGGFEMSDGSIVEAQQKIDGGPSVLYDAVLVLASEAGAAQLATDATTKDFVADAFAHCKFIGYAPSSEPLLDAVGIDPDDGMMAVQATPKSIKAFLSLCRGVRYWPREELVDRT
jgi:catalase